MGMMNMDVVCSWGMKKWIDEMDLDFGYLIQYSMSIIHLLFFTSSFGYCRDTPPKMNLHRN